VFRRYVKAAESTPDDLVRMEASEVNQVDLFVRSGAYRTGTPKTACIRCQMVWI